MWQASSSKRGVADLSYTAFHSSRRISVCCQMWYPNICKWSPGQLALFWGTGGDLLKSTNISLVLETFNWRKASPHQERKSSSIWPWPTSSSPSRLTKIESSAYLIINLLAWRLTQSFVYKIYKKADNTQPWGEPVEDVSRLDRLPLTFTCCDLLVRKSRIQPKRPASKQNKL